MTPNRLLSGCFAAALIVLSLPSSGAAFPVDGYSTVLPKGTELNEDALGRPTELFHAETMGGTKSYLVKLGDMAFSSPYILGDRARRAGVSCATCHVNGASNAKLYVPGMSVRPGTFDTTGPFFNPPADDGVLDALTIPSLRGARYLAPYGHDGRFGSLGDFVRNVIVNEFAGADPSPLLVQAMVAYIQNIDFLPNPRLGPDGRLTKTATASERRGEALFNKPFRTQPAMNCASCHTPSGAFVDHLQHDVGTGGYFKTPTLINADFNAPYFHDGRFDTYAQVIDYFDSVFQLRLSVRDKTDLETYLTAVGDGQTPVTPDGVDPRMAEIEEFSSVLDTAIAAHDTTTVKLTVNTVGDELREFTEHFPDRLDTTVTGGVAERNAARAGLKQLVLGLRKVELLAAGGAFDDAAAACESYEKTLDAIRPTLMAAVPYSLFTPAVHDAHYAALRQIIETAAKADR